MSLYQIRPLGLREKLIAFELQRGGAGALPRVRDIREDFVLWNPQGRPHAAYPEVIVERAMTGRELMECQQAAWNEHVATVRRLFGAAPLAGVPSTATPVRGLLAFPVALFSDRGRWTLSHRAGPHWYFTPAQLRAGTPRPLLPAREG